MKFEFLETERAMASWMKETLDFGNWSNCTTSVSKLHDKREQVVGCISELRE